MIASSIEEKIATDLEYHFGEESVEKINIKHLERVWVIVLIVIDIC